jgi:PKD repeat protein
MRRLLGRIGSAALVAAILAACAGTAPLSEMSVSSVAPAGAYGSFVVDGSGFFQYLDGRGMRVEACGVTVDAELVGAVTSEAVLPPAGLVAVEVAERLAFSVPAGAGSGTSDVRVVRPDGRAVVVEGAITCPSDAATVAVIDVGATEGYVPFTVSFSAEGSSGAGALSYEWDLGDGDTYTEREVTRTFTEPGEYVVSLTVRGEDGERDTASVTVTARSPVLGVTVGVKSRMALGGATRANAAVTVAGGAPETVTWHSSDESVVVVDEDGLVTAVGEGVAEVVATSTVDPEVSAGASVRVVDIEGASVLYLYDHSTPEGDPSADALDALSDELGVDLVAIDTGGGDDQVAAIRSAMEAGPDVVFFERRNFLWQPGIRDLMVDWVEDGGHMIFTAWTYGDADVLRDALQVSPDGTTNHGSMTVVNQDLLADLGSAELALTNTTGWRVFNLGFEHPADGEVWAQYEDGSAAIVTGNDGRTVTLGFLADALPMEDGVAFYENLVELMLTGIFE